MPLVRSSVLCTVLLASALAAGTRPAAGDSAVEVGGGFHAPFGSRESDVYGSAGALSLGYSRRLTPAGSRTDTRLIADATYLWASGAVVNDPTFDFPEERYWLLPLALGVRVNFVGPGIRDTFGLYGGLGVATVLSGYRDVNGRTDNAPGFGALIELRPELRLSRTLSLWVRDRIWVLGDVDYGDLIRGLNYSGSTLQMGLAWRTL